MGGHLFPSDARRDEESASLFDRSPLSAGSSPSPLLLGNAAKTPTTTRRHVVVRFICAPFTAVLRMKGARANASEEKLSYSDKAGMERGVARRPTLEELLRMEQSSSSCPEHKSPPDTVSCSLKDHAIVVFGITSNAQISCTVEEEQELLSLSKSHGAIVTNNDEQQTAIVPVTVDVGLKVAPGGSATASPAVPVSASLRRALLPALRLDMGRTKGRYRKLVDGCRDAGKAELFYQRPIPLGRRCRVQHLEESPYL